MIWGDYEDLCFGYFESLESAGVLCRVYSRRGGVSPDPWKSLNLGGMNGDSRENIIENRRRIFLSINRNPESIFDVWQVHGTSAICAKEPRPLHAEHQKADIIISNKPEVTLFMRFADCVPVFLYDQAKRVIGIVHAGWMGTVKKAVQAAILKMQEEYSTNPLDVLAVIGPSIGPDHYEVGLDVVAHARQSFGKKFDEVITLDCGHSYLNLWRANELLLRDSGVEQIEVANICTACDTSKWYSHRAEKGLTGRFAALIAIP